MCDENDISSGSSSTENLSPEYNIIQKYNPDFIPEVIFPERDIFGIYQISALEKERWYKDGEKGSIRFTKESNNPCNNELEREGILTFAMIAAGSSFIERGAIRRKYVRCKCVLSGLLLKNIDLLSFHHHLSYVDLSWNKLKSIRALGNLPCLMYLDVSHNLILHPFSFQPPHNLIFANYSHNCIKNCTNIEKFWSMVELDLSHNFISKICKGFSLLKFLKKLDLSYNSLCTIKHLPKSNLVELNLEKNSIVHDMDKTVSITRQTEQESSDEEDELKSQSQYDEEYGSRIEDEASKSADFEVTSSDTSKTNDEIDSVYDDYYDDDDVEKELGTAINISKESLLQVIYIRKKPKAVDQKSYQQEIQGQKTGKAVISTLNQSLLPAYNKEIQKKAGTLFTKKSSSFVKFYFCVLENLTYLNLANNNLKGLEPFKETFNLEKVIFSANKINDLSELRFLENLKFLVDVDFRDNEICSMQYYYQAVLHNIPHLKILDGELVKTAQRIATEEKFNPDVEDQAIKHFNSLKIINQFCNPPINAIFPVDQPPPPIIVVVGLPGGGHNLITDTFYQVNKKLLKMAKTYTTYVSKQFKYDVYNQEVVVSKEEFQNLILSGKLLTISENVGFDIAQSEDCLKDDDDRVTILCTDLVNAINLRFKGLRPTIVLAIPETEELHKSWLSQINKNKRIFGSSFETDQVLEEVIMNTEGNNKVDDNEISEETSSFSVSCVEIEEEGQDHPLTFISPTEHNNEEDKVYLCHEDFELEENLDETPDKLFVDNLFCERILENRREYLYFHQENPGVFDAVIFTNHVEKSCDVLKEMLRKCLQNQKKRFCKYDIAKDPCYKKLLDYRFSLLSNKIIK